MNANRGIINNLNETFPENEKNLNIEQQIQELKKIKRNIQEGKYSKEKKLLQVKINNIHEHYHPFDNNYFIVNNGLSVKNNKSLPFSNLNYYERNITNLSSLEKFMELKNKKSKNIINEINMHIKYLQKEKQRQNLIKYYKESKLISPSLLSQGGTRKIKKNIKRKNTRKHK